MKNLNFFLQPYGSLGIPNHSRDFARALAKVTNLKLMPIVQKPAGNDSDYDLDASLKSMFGKPSHDATSLMFWYPHTYWSALGGYPKNIGYYIFEYTKIPPQFVDSMQDLDGICTASKWGAKVLSENGVRCKIHVVPGGVSSKFNSNGKKLSSDVFRFLHIGKVEERKGTDLLLSAFNKAFEGNEKIRLTLSIDNPHINGFSAESYIKSKNIFHSNIDVIHHVDDIRKLYLTHHCAVFPTKAEGIGLPITEAMACGVPTIVSYNTGITEYANDKNAILLTRLKKVPVYDPHFFPQSGLYGEWESPTEDELIEKMKWVYENYEKAKEIGDYAEKWMGENFTWDQAADKFVKEVMGD